MGKASIKIIKRKNLGPVAAGGPSRNQRTASPAATGERHLLRKMTETVSSWVSERRENALNERVSAMRLLFDH